MQHPQQVQFIPDPSLPPGQGDLEALERLKEIIKSNQHEIFRAVPRPAALANLYKGPLPPLVPPHREQISGSLPEKSTTTSSGPVLETLSPTFVNDTRRAHVAPAVQGTPRVSSQSRASVPPRPGVSSDTVRLITPKSSSLTEF